MDSFCKVVVPFDSWSTNLEIDENQIKDDDDDDDDDDAHRNEI